MTDQVTTHRLNLAYSTPPIHSNQRLHWTAKARLTREARERGGWLARQANIGPQERIIVRLEWRPKDRRRRDGGENLGPLFKALVDGLVDAGVVPDDTPDRVERRMPTLLPVGEGEPGMWLIIETVPDAAA